MSYNNLGDYMSSETLTKNRKDKYIKKLLNEKYNVSNALVNYYLVLMFTLFPLYFTEKYSNIRHDKLNVYLLLSGFLIVFAGAAWLVSYFEKKRAGVLPEEKWYKQLSVPDWAFGVLILLYTISTLLSRIPIDAFLGGSPYNNNSGRNNGLLIFIFFFFVYIVISRFFRAKEYVYVCIAGGSLVVYLIAVLNFFYIDIFKAFGREMSIYYGYGDNTIKDFISTIGNKNIMSAFCCLTIPFLLMLYINSDKKRIKYFYLVSGGIGFSAMLCADSESGFLGLVPTLALILLFYSRKVTLLRKFFISLSAMFAAAKLLSLFTVFVKALEKVPFIVDKFFIYDMKDLAAKGNSKGFGTMQTLFIYDNKCFILIAVCIAAALGLWFLEKKKPGYNLPKAVPFALAAFYALAAAYLAGLFVKYSFLDTQSKLDGVMTFFRFNEKWGTHRGFMWIKSFEILKNTSIKNVLIGSGPDTFYTAFSPYFSELVRKFNNSTTNCAHNEFLNYLITTGVLGLTAYMTLFISAVIRSVKTAAKNPMAVVFIAPVICYLFQSVVNIANPEVTPVLFIFLALSEAVVRNNKNKE